MGWRVILTGVTVEIAARHHVCGWSIALSGEDNAVNEMRQLMSLDGPELLEISRVEAWVSCHKHFGVYESARYAVTVHGDTDGTLAFPQDTPSVADSEQQPRLGYENPALLFVPPSEHLGILRIN